MTYYNDNDPKTAAWLRELIHAGEIPLGDVDERSILEVKPYELTRYTQQHFFAGIGGWALALKLADWPDDKPVRTGSCPCQPFSLAGKQKGEADKRHLWPAFRDLITFGEATVTFGEQVSSPLGREWLARVRADLEGLGYEVGSADLCAACIGAPHPRHRLFWVAHCKRQRRNRRSGMQESNGRTIVKTNGDALRLANGIGTRLERRQEQSAWEECETAQRSGDARGLEHSDRKGSQPRKPTAEANGHRSPAESASGNGRLGDTTERGCGEGRHADRSDPWGDYDLCYFTGYEAGKVRRIEAGTFPLAPRVPGDVGLLRGYGNAIVPQIAAEFIKASLEALDF